MSDACVHQCFVFQILKGLRKPSRKCRPLEHCPQFQNMSLKKLTKQMQWRAKNYSRKTPKPGKDKSLVFTSRINQYWTEINHPQIKVMCWIESVRIGQGGIKLTRESGDLRFSHVNRKVSQSPATFQFLVSWINVWEHTKQAQEVQQKQVWLIESYMLTWK